MRRIGIGVAVMGMVLAITTPAGHAETQSAAGPLGTRVTLVTGDQVVLHGGEAREVRPGAGREGMRFSVHRTADHLYVIPADALRAVASGQIDRRLFDITTLTEFGYAQRDTVPLIVTGPSATRVASAGKALPSIDGYAFEATKGSTWRTLTAARGVSRIWLDGKRKAVLDHSVPQIGAPEAWAAGYTGAGVKVAVVDTGVDQTHPDLADREIAEGNFTDAPDNVDHFGHGTHVASIVAGSGAKSGGKYRGVSEASILDAKVLDDNGFGQDSWIIAGMEWAAQQGAAVANLSLGGTDTPEVDPLEEAVNALSDKYGTLFVIAAGNSYRDATIGSPGSADAALTVGAVDREDKLAEFSSRGPRLGDGAIKPDVTAPGVDIVAALHSDGTIGEPVEPGYTALSGTSMATPHVAGAAALLAQQHPDYTGQQLKAVLSGSAKPGAGLTAFQQGAGRIDVARAIGQTVVSEPTSVSVGMVAWPHDDDVPVAKPVTYRNLGDADVTLSLALDTTAPAGMFTLSANQVTVPAGGTAEVTVTTDAGAGDVDGYFSAAIVATAGSSVTRTPVAVDREVESYNLTIDVLDSTGAPTGAYNLLIIGLTNNSFAFPYDADGSVTLRLPKGNYVLDSTVVTGSGEDARFSLLVQPNLVLDKDSTVTFDARTAKPVKVTPPAEAELVLGDLGFSMISPTGGGLSTAFLTDDLSRVTTAHVGDTVPGTAFTAKINTQWAAEDGSYYGLAWFPHGRMPTGFTKVVRQRELATVRAEWGAQTPDRAGARLVFPFPVEGDGFVFAVVQDVELPGTRTEYLTTEDVRWQSVLDQVNGNDIETEVMSPSERFRAGHRYSRSFNHGVFGPTMMDSGFAGGSVYRVGNNLVVLPGLYGDKAGNEGHSVLDSASFELYRDGELVTSTDEPGGFAEVPAESAEYRAVVSTTRPRDLFDVSTAVEASWTFRSAFTDENTAVPQPVSVVRFTPTLDDANSAKAGRPFLVPVWLQHNATGAADRPRTLKVEVSYDEGKTWRKADVLLNMVALLNHPAGAESVSLRATATDRGGNSVTQTVIRAYKLRK